MGKPLTPELLAALGTLTWWAVHSKRQWEARLADHNGAIREIAERQDVSTVRAEGVYALVERQLVSEKVRQALPPGRPRS